MSSRLKINQAYKLSALKKDLRMFLKFNQTLAVDVLTPIADQMYAESLEEVPVKTGALRESINIRVSRSPRYPGIIATASARNVKTGYDYALIQEENRDYKHDEPTKYHYLADPFARGVEKVWEKILNDIRRY